MPTKSKKKASIEVEKNEVIDNRLEIDIVIYVAKSSQKSIVIGKDGEQLKKIGTATRKELQKIFNKKVMLRSWVKVKKNWNTNIERIQSLGIGNSIDVLFCIVVLLEIPH